MRRRDSVDDQVADAARRRLAALSAELAAARGEPAPVADVPSGPDVPEPPPTGRHARRPVDRRSRLLGWAGDRLPPSLRSRPHLGAAQMGVVLVVLAAGLLAGAWWLVRTSGGGAEVVAPAVVAPSVPATPGAASAGAAGAGAAGPTPSTAPPGSAASPSTAPTPVAPGGEGQVVVDVVGKVRRPGIAVLPAGSRVVDAVRAAGGLRAGVDRTQLNLARLLTDGEQVLVGVAGAAPPGPVGGTGAAGSDPTAGGTLVNINTADQAELETLPGIGPVTAAAILQWRAEHGAFTAVEELLEVSGIGDATLAEITPFVTL